VAGAAFFIVFIEIGWLYGFYNIGVVLFAGIHRRSKKINEASPASRPYFANQTPAVAILYTTYNDFVEASAESCVHQDYSNFTVYLLDDSTDPAYRRRVDAFAAKYPERVRVVRRPNRRGFKAGNLNHALAKAVHQEPFFAIADADEILPPDFLQKMTLHLLADPACGFVQANHRCNPNASSPLAKALGIGIDIHWKWYQPLRNKFGFVMFLGHGAVLRRKCWEVVGGFPEIVSEDLAYAIRIRERGWRGKFVEDVVCYEDFPESIRAFRVRHMKWTRGTCEFLFREAGRLIRSPRISWVEKLDILFPTLNLPLTLFYFLFMINANLVLPAILGVPHPLTMVWRNQEFTLPTYTLHSGFSVIYSADFFAITLLTFLAPVLCFILELANRPLRLFRFLSHSTAVYAALTPLFAVGVISYLFTGKATFLVTGDRSQAASSNVPEPKPPLGKKWRAELQTFLSRSHPDQKSVQAFEIFVGLVFAFTCLLLIQVSFLGLTIAFMLLPIMHRLSWEHRMIQRFVYLPFILIIGGLFLGSCAAFGMQPTFFGYGFHF